MKYSKLFITALSLAFIQSCSSDDSDSNLSIDDVKLNSSYSTNRLKIITIEPTVSGFENATYTWKNGNEIVGSDKTFSFVSDEIGTYQLTLEVKGLSTTKKLETQIAVNKESKAYSKYIAQVYDFMPAVGQFTNDLPEYVSGNTREQMIAKAASSIVGSEGQLISLGGYGGYVVFGFDHTIINKVNKRDFKILGNAFWGNEAQEERAGSCEPGVIMVAYDKNNNGVPDDDEWYEIAGSEYTNLKTIKNYSITYNKPDENKIPVIGTHGWDIDIEYVKWTDNQGNTGYKTKNSFHAQSYYPLWFGDNQLKFTGTLLPNNFYDQSGTGTYWVGKSYAYGYADNAPNNDEASNIDIDWAVDKNGNKVKLPGIDFIKVYTGINQEAGWLGEVSTEIMGAYDLHF
ncbi:PKD-like domain-containing protein [Empedobacter tilapiae]|uniref:PKD-like domain-containing protein n=1 Tax=Empedobacter tilapiae TaxID=2491114 RepID=UPI0028D302DE|nr:PKD-like domain-containing protein [Empedobacter tilapiae]